MFRWMTDIEGDIALRIFWGILYVVKYRDSTILDWFGREGPYAAAGRWQGKTERSDFDGAVAPI